MAKPDALVLAYKNCDTCKKALRWLEEHGVAHTVRAIVEAPPTAKELAAWIPASQVPVRKWLNTSGQSYRALGKEKVDKSTDSELAKMLSADGKLVKRPVLVAGETVLLGFKPEAYAAHFGK